MSIAQSAGKREVTRSSSRSLVARIAQGSGRGRGLRGSAPGLRVQVLRNLFEWRWILIIMAKD